MRFTNRCLTEKSLKKCLCSFYMFLSHRIKDILRQAKLLIYLFDDNEPDTEQIKYLKGSKKIFCQSSELGSTITKS